MVLESILLLHVSTWKHGSKMWLNRDENGRIVEVLELGKLCFHLAIAAICNAITVLERFCHTATEILITTKIAFWSHDCRLQSM